MVSKEEKIYKTPKIRKIWNFLIYWSTIAIGVFLIWLYSAYIFINKWTKVKKGGNAKRRNALLGKVENVSVIIELVDSWSKLEGKPSFYEKIIISPIHIKFYSCC